MFRQANLTAFADIVDAIRSHILSSNPQKRRLRCLELYGGVGTIGLHLADLCHSLVCSDENPYNKSCFEASAATLKQQLQQQNGNDVPSIRYEPKSAAQMVASGALQETDLVIVDPPRKGLEASVSAALATAGIGPQQLIYVSCGFDAFQRDYQILCHGGQWRLQHAQGHVLFPGSNAIETLAFFVRP